MDTLRFLGPAVRPDAATIAKALRVSTTVVGLLSNLGYAAEHRRYLHVISQGRRLTHLDPLPTDGEIVLALPMGGG